MRFRGMKKLTSNDWIKKAKGVHGDKYDYSKVDYQGSQTKVIVICHEHGEFKSYPSMHLKGRGCPICGNSRKGNFVKLNTDTFISKSKEVHGDRYDYSKVDYKGSLKDVTIICKEHGEFIQRASNHLGGQGCPLCAGRKSKKHK